MGKSENHVYNIDLQIKNTEASKAALKYMQDAFKSFEDPIDSMYALNDAFDDLASKTEDTTELQKQYNAAITKALNDRDVMIDKLNAEKIALMQNKDLTDTQREIELSMLNRKIEQIKYEKKIISIKTNEFKIEKKLSGLVKDDLIAIKDKIKEQFKFIAALKTTEGRYNAIKKAALAAGNASMKATKHMLATGAKVTGGALAFGGAMLGASASIADDVVNKENALQSLKSGIDPSIVDQVYVRAPAGTNWESIVAAVNNLSSVTKDNALLIQGAVLELKHPGVGKALLSTTAQDPNNISRFANALDQIKRQTGIQDLSAAFEAATKSKAVKDTGQLDYIQAYAALSQGGIEDPDKIDAIIKDISKKGGNLIDNLKKTDLTKYVRGQDKIRLKNTKLELNALDLNKSSYTSAAQLVSENLREFELKKNKLLTELLPVVSEVLNVIQNSLDTNTVREIANGLVELFKTLVPYVVKYLPPLIGGIAESVKKIEKVITVAGQAFKSGGIKNFKDAFAFYSKRYDEEEAAKKKRAEQLENVNKKLDNTESATRALTVAAEQLTAAQERKGLLYSPVPSNMSHASGYSSMSHYAQGGIATTPSICGEAGPELVIPLDYSRAGRVNQIINNFNTTQSFNMQSNQTTPLAFSQVIGQNRFIRRFAGAH